MLVPKCWRTECKIFQGQIYNSFVFAKLNCHKKFKICTPVKYKSKCKLVQRLKRILVNEISLGRRAPWLWYRVQQHKGFCVCLPNRLTAQLYVKTYVPEGLPWIINQIYEGNLQMFALNLLWNRTEILYCYIQGFSYPKVLVNHPVLQPNFMRGYKLFLKWALFSILNFFLILFTFLQKASAAFPGDALFRNEIIWYPRFLWSDAQNADLNFLPRAPKELSLVSTYSE